MIIMKIPTIPPRIEFSLKRIDTARLPMRVPMHREAFISLPPLNGPDIATKVVSNLLP
ncbi:MAG: hypothetical protein ABJB97_06625 [Acidobacteriota bacterium]